MHRTRNHDAARLTEVSKILGRLRVDQLGRQLDDPAAIRAGIPHWHPRLDGEGEGEGEGEGKGEGEGEGEGESEGEGKGDEGKTPDARAAAAERALAAANREVRRLKAEQVAADTKAKAEAGQYKDLYEEEKAKREQLEKDQSNAHRETLVMAALSTEKAKNPARALRAIEGLEDIETKADAERAVKALKKTDAYMFEEAPTRQKRGAGGGSEGDEDPKDGAKVNRLRRGLKNAVQAGG